jgi:hypothetical protein
MSAVYRDEKHAAARAIAGDTLSHCSRAAWQGQYRAGVADALLPRSEAGEPLSGADRLLQDALTRSLIRRALSEPQWLTLLAIYAARPEEQVEALQGLAACVSTPAGPLFRRWCVGCWALPAVRREFRQLRDWDARGTPERTLRHWRQKIQAQLDGWRVEALAHVQRVLMDAGLVVK